MIVTSNYNLIYAATEDSKTKSNKIVYGDLNNDSIIDSSDVFMMRNILTNNGDVADRVNDAKPIKLSAEE